MTHDRTYTLWHVIGTHLIGWTACPCDLFGMEWEPRRTRCEDDTWGYIIVVPACDRDDPIALGEAALRREFGDDVATYTPAKRTETARSASERAKAVHGVVITKADAQGGK